MSGKYAKKKRRQKRNQNRALVIAIAVLSVVLIALLAVALGLERNADPANPGQETEQMPSDSTEPVMDTEPSGSETENTTLPVEEEYLFDLGNGVKILGYIPYTGAFVEDRTDDVVTDVLGIRIKNTGDQYIQTMDVTLTVGQTQAQFSLSTLFPGDTVVALEKNRMAYSTAPEFEQAKTSTVALFDSNPGMCEDQLEIQCLNGVMNITNISGEDITGDIFIYYKNYVSGIYYGGITYRVRIAGGMKADQIYQGSAAHFSPNNSAIVFVTCG